MIREYAYRKKIRRVRWLLFWVIFVQVIAEYAMKLSVSFLQSPPHQYIQIAIVELVTFLVPIIIYGNLIYTGEGKRDNIRLKSISVSNILLVALLAVCGQFIMMLLNIPANYIMDEFFKQSPTDAIPIALNLKDLMLGMFAIGIVPAVLEEFWMRGIVFGTYSEYSKRSAVIFTTIMFAVLHARIGEMLGFLFLGVMTSFVLIKTNSLYSAMIYHLMSNMTALIFGYILGYIYQSALLWIIFGIAIAFFVLLLIIFYIQNPKYRIKGVKGDGKLIIKSLFSLPVLLSVLLVILKACFSIE